MQQNLDAQTLLIEQKREVIAKKFACYRQWDADDYLVKHPSAALIGEQQTLEGVCPINLIYPNAKWNAEKLE